LSDAKPRPLSEQSFTAATRDGTVFVRVAVRGHVLGVQIEPAAMKRSAYELAERIMACADVAYLQGQVAQRDEFERGHVAMDDIDDMPTERDLAAARDRLEKL
jgi:hypothetical protein